MPWDKSTTDPIQWAAKMKDAPRNAINIFAFEVFKRVVIRTPVDTGQARSNWLVTLNQKTDDVKKADISKRKITRGKNKGKIKVKVKLGQTATQTLDNGKSTIETAKGDDMIIIQNNLPYMGVLEFGGYPKNPVNGGVNEKGEPKTVGGFSRQAPNGMVGVTLAKADQLWEKAVKAAKEMNP
jgi:hypothetical protein